MMMNKLKTMSAFLLLLSSVGGLASLTRAAEPQIELSEPVTVALAPAGPKVELDISAVGRWVSRGFTVKTGH